MRTITGSEIFGQPKDIADKIAYMEIALKNLADSKGIILHIDSCTEDTNTICPYISGRTCGDAELNYTISDVIFNDDPTYWCNEEHQEWAFEKRLVIRLAKIFFDEYKKYKEIIRSASCSISNAASIGQTVYASRVDAISSTVDIAEQKIKELEDQVSNYKKELDAIKKELQDKDAMIRIVWNTMVDKGMFK